jgi:transcriptional regulator with XRE-family HTH domain
MAAPRSPATSRRWLAEQLRKLREDRGLAQKDAAQACGWSGAKLSYLETGQRGVVEDDLHKLLAVYGVPEDRRRRFYEAVEDAQTQGWWERFDHLVGDWLPAYVGLEQGAALMRSFEPLVVPGILQTGDYATALMESGVRRRSPREIERLVELRVSRQAILTRDEGPTAFDVVIDESVLVRSPRRDSRPADGILAAQLAHLLDAATLPNVTLRVLPMAGGVQSYSAGPFSILSFPGDQPDPVVYLEHRGGAMWLEDFDSITRYELTFQGLVDMALDPERSLAMVREVTERQTGN